MFKNKFIYFVLIILILLSGCQKKQLKEKNELLIITSFYPIYISTINITKDIPGVKVINLTKPQTGCLHDYQLTTDDLKSVEKADIFIANGAGMESFINKLLTQIPDLKIIEASKGITLLKNSISEHSDNNDENPLDYNPHVWVSISLAIEQVKNIAAGLASIDVKHSKQYNENADNYIKKLSGLKIQMHKELDSIKNKNIITFHEAFPYFAKEFNFNIVAVIEREPGSEPNSKELADTIAIIKKQNVKAIFAEPQYPAKAAETIAKETGLKLYILDPVVTGDMTENAYLSIMKNNLNTLKEALK